MSAALSSSAALQGLKEILADEDIPPEWGGTRSDPFYNSQQEISLFRTVADTNGCTLDDLAIDGMFDPEHARSSGDSKAAKATKSSSS